MPAHPRTLPRPAWCMCSHAAILVPALPEYPRGHPLLSALARCPLGAPSRPQLVGLVCGPGGGPKPLAWPRAGTRSTCVTGRVWWIGPVCAGPASEFPQTLAHGKEPAEMDASGTPVPTLACCKWRPDVCRPQLWGRPPSHPQPQGNWLRGCSGMTSLSWTQVVL